MNGVHDLGGLDGLGAVDPPPEEPVFYSEWEKRVFTMFVPALLAGINLDEFRHGIERMHPVEYLAARYYEHWLHTIEGGLVERGIIDEQELEERTRHFLENPDAPLPEARTRSRPRRSCRSTRRAPRRVARATNGRASRPAIRCAS